MLDSTRDWSKVSMKIHSQWDSYWKRRRIFTLMTHVCHPLIVWKEILIFILVVINLDWSQLFELLCVVKAIVLGVVLGKKRSGKYFIQSIKQAKHWSKLNVTTLLKPKRYLRLYVPLRNSRHIYYIPNFYFNLVKQPYSI